MSSPEQGSSGLEQNCDSTPTTIDLMHGMSYRFLQFVERLIQKAIAHCAGNNQPV